MRATENFYLLKCRNSKIRSAFRLRKCIAHCTTLLFGVVASLFLTNCLPSQARIHGAKTLEARQQKLQFYLQFHVGMAQGEKIALPDLVLIYRQGFTGGLEAGLRLHSLYLAFPMGFMVEAAIPTAIKFKEGNGLLHLEAGYHLWDFTQLMFMNKGRTNSEGDSELYYLSSAIIFPLSESYHNTISGGAYFKKDYIEPVFGEAVGYTSKSERVKEVHLHLSPLRQVVNFAF
jgi:hypothetical protein